MAKTSSKSKAANGGHSAEQQNVVYEYIKSQLFRVIHADGIVGGVTPSGNLHMAVFSERPAIPKMMVHRRNPNGTLGDLIPEQTLTRPGFIREMDVDIVMRPDAVDSLVTWLQARQADLRKYQEAAKKVKSGADKKKGEN